MKGENDMKYEKGKKGEKDNNDAKRLRGKKGDDNNYWNLIPLDRPPPLTGTLCPQPPTISLSPSTS